MSYPLKPQAFGRADSLYGAVAKLVEANINIGPIVEVSMYPLSAKYSGGSDVSFYYFMAPDNDPDMPDSAQGWPHRNVAHYCPDTGAVTLEVGPDGFGREFAQYGYHLRKDIGSILLPLLVKRQNQLFQAAESHARQRALEESRVVNVWAGYRNGRVHAYVTPEDESPGLSDCRHVLVSSISSGIGYV